MISVPKSFVISLAFALTPFVFAAPTFAATPDGAGPWADSVHSASQGLMKDGNPVPAIRSDATSALGVAENDTVEGHFYSLGFGGKISLGFDNGISSGVILVEATNPGYPGETAKVEVSENGSTWVNAGNVSADGTVNKPEGVSCAKYVRITDTSNPNDFSDATADGYDVDGVKATGEPCNPPTGGGAVSCTSTVVQGNVTNVSNTTVISQNTGGNKIKKNTGAGNTSIATGNATAGVTNTTTGGSNIANAGCCGCGGTTDVVIANNGNGSTNTVILGASAKKAKKGK